MKKHLLLRNLQFSIKPIDYFLGQKDTDTYKYLKQYTTMNSYISYDELSWYNPSKYCYYFGFSSDDDTIHMKDYGTYMGGTGKDSLLFIRTLNTKIYT